MKQETLEEVAKNFIPKSNKWTIKDIFIDGANWMQERSYSEEDMVKFVSFVGKNYIKAKGFYYMKGDFEKKHKVSIHQILEQFKNK
jgi:hypothetical protein